MKTFAKQIRALEVIASMNPGVPGFSHQQAMERAQKLVNDALVFEPAAEHFNSLGIDWRGIPKVRDPNNVQPCTSPALYLQQFGRAKREVQQ